MESDKNEYFLSNKHPIYDLLTGLGLTGQWMAPASMTGCPHTVLGHVTSQI